VNRHLYNSLSILIRLCLLFTSALTFAAPSITSISPTSVKPGMSMTLTGSGFGTTQGTGSVTFYAPGDTVGVSSYSSWSNTQIVLTVPNNIAPGVVYVTQSGAQSNQVTYTTIAPTLTSISPTSVKPGMTMTLTGSGFGASQGIGSVTFYAAGDTVGVSSYISWSDTQIVLTVPNRIAPGNIYVTQNGTAGNQVAYTTIAPTLNTISPTAVKPGMQMVLTGSGFGASQGIGSVTFYAAGDTVGVSSYISWSDTQIVLTVPNRIAPGNIYVTQNGTAGNQVPYTTIAPTLTAISPTAVKPGMAMTLTGSGFGATQGIGKVTFYAPGDTVGVSSYTSWSDTQIVLTVPNNIAPGNIYVTQNGSAGNQVAYTTIAPTLTSISPTSVTPGMTMTLTGSGFGATQGIGKVTFYAPGDTVGVSSYTSWSATQIVLTVPNNIAPGNIYVTQNGSASNQVAYTTIAPTLTSISPTTVQPGMAMTLTGSGFGAARGIGGATFAAAGDTVGASQFSSWSNTQIILTVPPEIASGSLYVDQNGVQSNGIAYTAIIPTISSISPSSGGTGASVTITGTNFGATQGTSTVTFNGTLVTPNSWSATSIVVAVPSGVTTGPVAVTVDGERSNTVTFTDTSAPTISSLSPSLGKAGIAVTISGLGFGTTQGSSTVTFNGTTATVKSWAATQVVVTTPTGVTTGDVLVTVGGVASNGILFTAAPIISSLSPASGPVGGVVSINGTSFGAAQGTSTVTFNGTAATPKSWTATQIVATVPTGATTGSVVVTSDSMASSGVKFTVTSAPSITSISPTSAAAGTTITITGANFGSTQGTNTVTFNGTPATPSSWSATSIKVPVPAGATTGPLVVTVDGVASNGITFTVLPTPTITSLAPSSGIVGTVVTVTGTNFGATQGSSTVTFNGKAGTAESWSSTQIVVPVPTGATTGNVVVTVGGVASAGVLFTVPTAPTITAISPSSGPVGASVTISGANFGSTQGSSTVKFNGTTGTPTSWAASQIVVPVPSGATSGNIVVTVGGVASNGMAFTVLPTPSITSLSPTSGGVGASVTIKGTNFGATQGTSTVSFDGVGATVTNWSATQIVTTVPSGALTGVVIVNVNGVASNSVGFTVLATPNITSVVPGSAAIGGSITIGGTDFGATQGSSTVSFNGKAGIPTTWGATQIVVPVPSGATTGNLVVTVNGVASNAVPFTILLVPSITSLSPTSGAQGAAVTITGTNFGSSQGTSSVTFNGTQAVVTSWANTSIVTSVPADATTGNVVVTVNGVSSNGVNFTVTGPAITSISPTSGNIGTSVTINGSNFGTTQGSSTVTFNGITAKPTTWGASQIVAPVPNGATTGNVVVTVNGVATTGTFSFQVEGAPAPVIQSGWGPTLGPVGMGIQIVGINFGAAQGASTVSINGSQIPQADILSWSATGITIIVPAGTTNGPLVVTVGGVQSNGVTFTIEPSFSCN
jgi:hypothetical protein